MSRIFLSHSSKDTREAIALKTWLTEQRPELRDEIFIDVDSETGLKLGEHWKTQLFTGKSRCEHFICLLSQSWANSTECNVEYRTAEGLGKRILVARLEDLGVTHDITSAWQRCDLFADGEHSDVEVPGGPPVRFNTAALTSIMEAVDGSGTGPRQFVWPPRTDPNRAPYRGWEPFEEIDAGVFFGRDAVIARGVDALQGMRFRLLASMSGLKSLFVVLGPSGSGKSSFLRAGLIPRLRRQDRQFVVLGIMRPQGNALTGDSGLAAAIHAGRESLDLPSPSLGDIKKACGHRDVDQVVHLLREIRLAAAAQLASHAKPQASVPTLVLPIDQAEELFSADAGPQTEEFLSMLAELIQRMNADEVGMIVAVTIRTDCYEAMQSHPALDGIGTAIFDDLKPMPREEFKEVIIGPAARATEGGKRLVIQDGLVASLLRDAGDGADTLPLVALTLSRLYADYGGTGEISAADYEAMGGMTDVVKNVIEELLSQYPEGRSAALELLRSAFIPWLATINSLNDQALRRVALESDLPRDGRPLIDAFVAKRLLVRDERDGKVVIEVALESLLRQWDTLAGWLTEERLNLKIADDIERNAAAWESQGRDESWLFTGTRLDDAEKLSTREGFNTLLASSQAYLKACRDAEDQRLHDEEEQRNEKLRHAEEAARHAKESQQAAESHARVLRRRSRVLAAVALVAILAAGAAIYGFVTATQARKQANARTREAIAVRLTSDGRAILGGDLEGGDIRAIQEILAAPRIASTADSGALYDGLVGLSVTLKIIGTPNPSQDMSLSPDGHRIATAQFDGSLRLWDSGTGQPIGSPLTGHRGPVETVVFGPDGRRIFSGGDDNTVRVWNADTGQQIGAPLLGHTDKVTAIAISPDGHRLVSGSNDRTLRMWNADTGQPIGAPLLGNTGPIGDVEFSPNGHQFASGGDDKTVRLWNADTGQQIGPPLLGHTDWVQSLAYSPDGRRLVSASFDKTLRIWDPATGQPVGQPLVGHTGSVASVAYSPDGQQIISGGEDDVVRIWDANTGQAVGDPRAGPTGWVTGVQYSPDGRRFYSSSNDGTVWVWNSGLHAMGGHDGNVLSARFSPDGHRIVSGGEDKTVRLWNADTGLPMGQPMTGHTDAVTSVTFSPDGHRVASASKDGTVRLWDPDTGRPIGQPFVGHTGWVTSVAFSPDGNLVASAGHDKTVRLWNANTGTLVGQPMVGATDAVSSVVFSPDGHQIASGSFDNLIRLWDVGTGHLIGQPWSGHTGGVTSLAFFLDGRHLVSGSQDDTLRMWDVSSGKTVGDPMKGHTGTVTGVSVSSNGHRVMSGSEDKYLRLWDADTGKPIGQPLAGHSQAVNSVAFSPDRHRVVSASDDGELRLWPAPPKEDWVNQLCDKLSANMTHAEWDKWVSPSIEYIKLCPNLPDPPST
ncbi:TIR domain-containing protein [Mycobacterium numidiamassiliense]|uniref:nSTAND1 domain-containing NTPase n=1 Tax=Mycobacterium numidiamassiliense TaxID=1841861 RepID=UPI00097D6549|nr:TIR domain-containing protein [Mycobacterium numidiamassiliense]